MRTDAKVRTDADAAMAAIDAEDQRQADALRKYYQRERAPVQVTGKAMLRFLLRVAVIGGSVFGFLKWIGVL